MSRKLGTALVLVLCSLHVACGQVAVPEAPAPTASGSLVADSQLEAIRSQVQSDVDAGQVAGAVVLLARSDEQLMFESFGVRSLEADDPMRNDAIFRIYSMTKPLTSVAVMILHEQGHFELDDPVGVYIPELTGLVVGVESADAEEGLITVPAERDVTIRDLLRHTSGMTYGLFADSVVDALYQRAGALGAADLESMVTALSSLPLKHQPGAVFEYSVSTDVLARLVEVVSGQRFDAFLQAHILGPLGMADTAFWVEEDKRDRFAGYYSPGDDGLEPVPQGDRYLTPPTFLSGGGGLVSTAADYLRFCRMVLAEGALGDVRILRAETVAAMATDQLAGLPGVDGLPPGGTMVSGFGLGFALTPDAGPGEVSPGTLYWGGLASTSFWIDRETGLIGIYMIQRQPFSAEYGQRFQNLVYASVAVTGAAAEDPR